MADDSDEKPSETVDEDVYAMAIEALDAAAAEELPLVKEGQLVDHYEVGKKIGAGSTCQVYEATDTKMRDAPAIALKVFFPGQQAMAALKEALQGRKIPAGYFPAVYDSGVIVERPELEWVAMERVQGRALLQELAELRRGPLEHVIELFIALADAVAAAHTQGIVVADLKPEHVIHTDDGKVKVLDLGLATLSQSRGERGTLLYMAPEALRGEGAGKTADVWAIGVMLYEALTTLHPFCRHDDLAKDVRDQVLRRSEYRPVSERRTDLLRAIRDVLDDVLDKALAAEPHERYADAQELGRALGEVLRQIKEKPLRTRSRRLGLGLLAAVALLLIAVAATIWARRSRDEARSRDLASQAEKLIDREPTLALSLALYAAESARTPQAAAVLARALVQPRELHFGPLFSASLVDLPSVAAFPAPDCQAILVLPDPNHSRVKIHGSAWACLAKAELKSCHVIRPKPVRRVAGRLMHASPPPAFSPDGRWMVQGLADGQLEIRDTRSGDIARVIRYPGRPLGYSSNAFSPDGERLLAHSGDVATLWVWRSGRLLAFLGGEGRVTASRFSGDGRHALVASSSVRVFALPQDAGLAEALTLSATPTPAIGDYRSCPACARSASLSFDGRRAAAIAPDGGLHVWESGSGRVVYSDLDGPAARTTLPVRWLGFLPASHDLLG